jgi:hypothetical protein
MRGLYDFAFATERDRIPRLDRPTGFPERSDR